MKDNLNIFERFYVWFWLVLFHIILIIADYFIIKLLLSGEYFNSITLIIALIPLLPVWFFIFKKITYKEKQTFKVIKKDKQDFKCSVCGSNLKPDDKFCNKCGTKSEYDITPKRIANPPKTNNKLKDIAFIIIIILINILLIPIDIKIIQSIKELNNITQMQHITKDK